jgi:cyclohexyl-isocyanide hydratase
MTLHFGLLVFPAVELLDFVGPHEVFASVPDAKVHLIWKSLSPVVSAKGIALVPTTSFEDCPALDVLCVPGGAGVNALLSDAAVLDFLRTQSAKSKYVSAVCTGALVLGAAGLLKGKRATTHWNAHDFLPSFGAIPVAERVVRDGSLFTAGGVTAGIDFGLTMIAELLGPAQAQTIQLAMEYAPQPPFQAGTPAEASPAILAAAKEKGARMRQERETIIAALPVR